ncbi:protein FAR1-RELATED SEQUENCE 1-like isoform X2 [Rhodamnia argentea]|uniref:Protein FAR1-RELATED SEQUENCE n=1 Tax=Rhodamnia argentea TaxID=178133 RepID=A0ABM3HK54_9MYRT|nr:protein FAR1-RELATED SEQUENCE 1-like isoform X2 [Rhodamnia argentea]
MLYSTAKQISGAAFRGLVCEYTLKCMGIQGEHVVRFNAADFSVSCDCTLFESKGWLCRHALHVLNMNISVSVIPSFRILKRWTKGAKQGNVNDEFHQMSPGRSTFDRFSTSMRIAFEVMSLGAEDRNTMRIVKKNLDATVAEISSYKSSVVVTDDASDDDSNETSLCEMSILEPLQRKGKGTSYGRLKSLSEKKKKKSKKVIPPVHIESQEFVVQATHNETHLPNYSRNSNQIRNAFCPSNNGDPRVYPNFHNHMQSPYIMLPRIMNGFFPITSKMQPPYIMLPGIMNGFCPLTSQMLEDQNRSHGSILSQSSNSFQDPRMHELNNPECIDNARSHHNLSEGRR